MKEHRFKRVTVLHLLFLILAVPTFAADIPCSWTGVERIVAIGDLHGDYEAFLSIIKDPGLGIVDEELHWKAGRTHFVQLGDVLDRGHNAKLILDLIISLEKEAEEAGGMVHFLLGNHEEVNLMGISLDYPDYVVSQQFFDFLPEDYRERKYKEFLATLPEDERKWIEDHPRGPIDPNSKEDLFWRNLRTRRDRDGEEAKEAYYEGLVDTYGPWLFQKNIVVKINSVVFAHGGLNEKYSKMKIGELNKAYRRELEMLTDQRLNRRRLPASFRPRMVYQPDSPLWYRDLADTNGRMAMKTVSRILDNLGASSMVVGHTIASNGGRSPIISQDSMNRFEGRIWTIDTGISSYYGGASSAWVYNGGEITIWPADQVELPERSAILAEADSLMNPQETELYLKTAPVLRIKKSEVVGRTDPWTITLDDGKTVRRGVFKYINRRRQADTLLADSFKYEVAAYALSRHLGLEIVPPVVEREIDGIPGSLQIFVENAITETDRRAKKIEPPDPETFLTATQVARVFENLVANACDDTDDTFVQDGTWKIFRIDFSEAFRAEPKLMPGCEFTRITRSLYEKLRGWDDQKIFDLMAPYLNPDETKALNTRRILILQRIDRLIREKGEKAVLFD